MARKKLTFESAMESLETIVNELETNDIPLSELMNKYSEGMKMSAFCLEELNKAEQAVNSEVKSDGGRVVETKLEIENGGK